MALSTDLVAETATRAIQRLLDEHDAWPDEAEVCAVGVVVVIDTGDGTFTRVHSTHERHYELVGLFSDALDVARGDDDD